MKKEIAKINSKLIKEWHPEKNGPLSPNDFSAGSHYNAWWLGECGHEWQATIKNRSRGTGCPICSGKKIIKGINLLQFVLLLDLMVFLLYPPYINNYMSVHVIFKEKSTKICAFINLLSR